MSDLNIVIVSGTVEEAPKLVTGQRGDIVNFTITNVESWDGGQRKNYIRCVAYGQTAKSAALVDAGDIVVAQGKWNTRSWEDRNGQKQRTTEVVLSAVGIVGAAPGSTATIPSRPQLRDDELDNIPF